MCYGLIVLNTALSLSSLIVLLLGCPPGTYGDRCEQKCDCDVDATCDPLNGKCICPVGKTGSKCENSKLNTDYLLTE